MLKDKFDKIKEHNNDTIKDNPVTTKEKENEISKYDAVIGIRKHISLGFIILIYASVFFIILVSILYMLALIGSSMYDRYDDLFKNIEKIFYKIVELLPWVLLFLFGDHTQIKQFLKNKNE